MICDLCDNRASKKYKLLDLCEECFEASEESDYQYKKQKDLERELL